MRRGSGCYLVSDSWKDDGFLINKNTRKMVRGKIAQRLLNTQFVYRNERWVLDEQTKEEIDIDVFRCLTGKKVDHGRSERLDTKRLKKEECLFL